MNLIKLAERVEAAAEGSRELDWLIAEAIGEVPAHSIRTVGFDYDWYRKPDEWTLWRAKDSEGRSVETWSPRARTSSIDAAITLLPTDGTVTLLDVEFSWEPKDKRVWPAAAVRWYPPYKSGPNWHALTVTAATLPLTLCAAALRAKAGEGL